MLVVVFENWRLTGNLNWETAQSKKLKSYAVCGFAGGCVPVLDGESGDGDLEPF
jgi:hypothetical protein